MSFPVVILAGGLATRIRPLTQTLPKAMLPLQGKPFVEHQLNRLREEGIRDVFLCLGYLGEQVEEHLSHHPIPDLRIHFAYDGPKLLGTAGAIRSILPSLPSPFFVLYGDSYLLCRFSDVQTCFLNKGKPALMTVYRNENLWDQSNVLYRDGEIVEYNKRAPHRAMQHIDYGLGVFTQRAFEAVPPGEVYDLADLYHNLANEKKLAAFETHSRFYEVGSFSGIEEFSKIAGLI